MTSFTQDIHLFTLPKPFAEDFLFVLVLYNIYYSKKKFLNFIF